VTRAEYPELSDDRIQALLDALPEPAVVHERGVIVTCNRALVALVGADSIDDLIGRNAVDLVHPDDRELVIARLRAPAQNRRTPEHRILDRNGVVIPIEVTGVPFPFRGKLTALAILHDLRERKRIDVELAAADRLASLGRLASAVGHEINNPLTYVLGSLELLDRELTALGSGHEAMARMLERVRDAREGAMRVRDIVRDLRTLSSPSDGAVGDVDLGSVLDRAIATAMHEIEHRAQLVRDDGDIAAVVGSEGRLIQVFVNLLVNAAHAIRDGDAAANEIRVVTRMADGAHVTVEVIDTGHGFDAGDASRLFEPFYTTKSGSGTGLGLSIAHRIVTSLGGSIVAEPRTPRGSCFRVTLVACAPGEVSAAALRAPAPVTRRARVLFADDEPMIRKLAFDALAPHDVTVVASGRDAIEALQRERFDAILCDLQMPDLGGVDVYEWIVASRPELAKRIVFMSGGAFTDRARELVATTTQPYLDKPLDLERMRELVAKLVRA
jgi:PAS domain S-box-containing protein